MHVRIRLMRAGFTAADLDRRSGGASLSHVRRRYSKWNRGPISSVLLYGTGKRSALVCSTGDTDGIRDEGRGGHMGQLGWARLVIQRRGVAIVLLAALLLAACSNGPSPTATPKPGGTTPGASAPAVTASPGTQAAQDKISKVFLQLLAL